jgi:carbonic anhydrase
MATEDPKALLTRRDLLKTGAAAAVIAGAALRTPGSTALAGTAPAPPGAWNHDPASPIGPLHWADIGFPTCGQGMSQSPVDIRTDQVAAYHGAPLLLRYESSELAVENTGHVVEVPIPADADDTLQIGGGRYGLVQYHFHAPSEHALDGRRAAVEAHFVHTNAQGATAVVGVFYRRGPTRTRCWTGSCCRRRKRWARRPTPVRPARRRCSGISGGSARYAVGRSG